MFPKRYYAVVGVQNYSINIYIGLITNNSVKPILEWQFDVEIVLKFKRYGAITVDIKTHIGTKKLERTEFILRMGMLV